MPRVSHQASTVPSISLGTYQLAGDTLRSVLRDAMACGYRAIDSAQVYRNEQDIGSVLAESNVPRHDLFITTKIAPTNQGADKAYASVLVSLQKLKLDYIDLVLIHWPGTAKLKPHDPRNRTSRTETWHALEKLVRDGKIHYIGVSNYTATHLTELLADIDARHPSSIAPIVNQVEIHPLCLPRADLVELCEARGITLQAYSSLGEGNLLTRSDDLPDGFADVLEGIVERVSTWRKGKKVTKAQVLLKWALQHGYAIIPKASSGGRVRENIDLEGFELEEGDLEALDAFGRIARTKYCWDPEGIS
ncbi:hypothetical protein HK101_003307 [Irineochytrium annulatum]|nr:hypothetical protein HK101_003306 [Irineochytrium annulatum]KAJ3194187.1 hypothetical protein HK101_003307 [Irineochytrium annulatum]